MTFPGKRVRFRLLALAGLLVSALTVVVAPAGRPAGAVAATPPVLPVCPVPSTPAEWYATAAAHGPAVMLTPANAASYVGADVVRGFRMDCAWQASQQSTYHIDPAVYGTNVTYSYAAVASAKAVPAVVPVQGDASRLVTFSVTGRSPVPWPKCLPMGEAPECGDPVANVQAELLERFPAGDGTFTDRPWGRITPASVNPFRFVRQGDCDGGTHAWRGAPKAFGSASCSYLLTWRTTPGFPGGIVSTDVQLAVQTAWYEDVPPTAQFDGQVVPAETGSIVMPMALDLDPAPTSPPSVGITWSAAGSPGAFAFSGNAAATAPATIARYDWNFGDGDVRLAAGPNPIKTWTGEASSRTVTLTVMDTDGATATATATLRPSITITEAPTDPAKVKVGDTASLKVVVANDGPATVTGVTPTVVIGPGDVATPAFAVTPAAASLAPGTTQTFTVPFLARAAGTAGGTIDARGTAGGTRIDAAQREFTAVIGNPGLLVEMSGQVVEVGRSFAVALRITNPGIDAVEDIRWSDPTGVLLEPGDNPPAAEPSVTYLRGPDAPLPTTLASKQSVSVVYVFNAPFTGTSVLTAEATGRTVGGGTAVSGKQAMSVLVVAGWSESARDLLAVQGLEEALGAQADTLALYENQLGGQIVSTLGWQEVTAAQVTSLQRDGLRRPGFDSVLAGALRNGVDQAGALVNGWTEGFALGMDKFGTSGGEALANLFATVEDPTQRHLAAQQIWETVKGLPSATSDNLGYAGHALAAPFTIEGLQTIKQANGAIAAAVVSSVSDAAVGSLPLLADYLRQYRTDPVGAMKNLGNFGGDVTWKGSEAGMMTAVGELGTAAVAKVGAPLLKGGLGLFRKGGAVVGDEATALAGAGLAGTDAAEAMTLRMAQAQKVVDNYQTLPVDAVLDVATATGKGGVLAEDAKAIQGILKKANDKFGVPFELQARTQEVLSSGIDGIAKPEFVKPKAVSMLDQMMGADPGRAGRVGLFEPKPLDLTTVGRLDKANPGFAKMYQERLASQQKLWKEWKDPNSRLRVLTEAGGRYAAKEPKVGITVLLDRPGNPLPYDLKYLEQLDEAEFLRAKGIDAADVPKIKADVLASNVDTYKALPTATVGPNGTTFIDEALSGKPFVSDLDIQSIGPQSGTWPKGVSRGQIETFFKAELSKLKRFPFHGWSDAAVDLPSDFYMAAVPFQLGNANPALALEAANRVAGRLSLLEKLARAKADKLLAAGDLDGYHALLDPFDKLRELKDPATGLYSSQRLLKKFPPGEKTINFTAGDIRVGYGTGGK